MLYLTEPDGSRREHFGHLAREFSCVGIAPVLQVALEKHHGGGVHVYAPIDHDVATFDRKRLHFVGRQLTESFSNKPLYLRRVARGEDQFSLCAKARHGRASLYQRTLPRYSTRDERSRNDPKTPSGVPQKK